MLLAIDFLLTQAFQQVVITEPNTVDNQWRATITTTGGTFTGYAENGHEALINAIRRYRDTNPSNDIPRQMGGGTQWADTVTGRVSVISSNPFVDGSEA